MTDIVERLRSTTEQMASNCSVIMLLWCEHSGAALEAADEIERLRLSLPEARSTGRREGLGDAALMAEARAAEYDKFFDATAYKAETLAAIAALTCLAAAVRAAMEKA